MSFLDTQLRRPPDPISGRFFRDGSACIDLWHRSQLEAYQAAALKAQLRHAFDNNRFYRDRFKAAGVNPHRMDVATDLAHVPFTTKDDLRGKPWVLLSVPRHQISQIHVSTGTTGGEEIYVPYTWSDLHDQTMSPAMRTLFPAGRNDVVAVTLPYEMSSSGLAFHRTFQKGYGAHVLPVGKGGYYSTPDHALKIMNRFGATLMLTTPSYAVYLAEHARETGVSLAEIPLKRLWLTGEGCSPALRERIEALWGRPAFFYYGSLEGGPLGIECTKRAGYHVTCGHVFMEIVDPKTGKNRGPGEIGEIVITELTRRASPLIRFRTGDLGYSDPEPCSCGVTLPKVVMRGRVGDQVRIGEQAYGPYYLEQFLLVISEVGNWYEFVPGAEELQIRVELARGVEPSPEVASLIRRRFSHSTGVPCAVEIVDRIPRTGGKTVRVRTSAPPAGVTA